MDLIPISYPTRFKHIYIPGGTGAGKSTQLLNLAAQDIWNGAGITILDPKGDLVKDLLDYVPEHRVNDTVYIDLDHPIPFDFMSFNGETEKDELVGDLIFLLLRDAGNAPRAKGILTDVLYTLLGSNEPTTFLDITRFLIDKKRRGDILKRLDDRELKDEWKKGVPSDEKLEPIIGRMKPYLRNSVLKKAFGAPPQFTIADVMNERKILLVNLGGASTVAKDYGSLLFMKMKQETFRRHKIPKNERIPHFLFMDEFQNFAQIEDFKDVLLMARGYKLAMTLANPSYHDLPGNLKGGIGIVGTYICYRLDQQDIPFFKTSYDGEYPETLAKLKDFHAYYKIKGQPGIKKECHRLKKPPVSFAETIKARFAENGTNQPSTGQNPSVSHDEVDGDPENTREQDLPPNPRQNKRGRRAR